MQCNIFCGVMLVGNTLHFIMVRYKWKSLFAKDLVKAFTVSDTACYTTVLLI